MRCVDLGVSLDEKWRFRRRSDFKVLCEILWLVCLFVGDRRWAGLGVGLDGRERFGRRREFEILCLLVGDEGCADLNVSLDRLHLCEGQLLCLPNWLCCTHLCERNWQWVGFSISRRERRRFRCRDKFNICRFACLLSRS